VELLEVFTTITRRRCKSLIANLSASSQRARPIGCGTDGGSGAVEEGGSGIDVRAEPSMQL
jgi:hypothetical protein